MPASPGGVRYNEVQKLPLLTGRLGEEELVGMAARSDPRQSAYTYNSLGERITRTDSGTGAATGYLYNSRHQLVSVTHSNGAAQTYAYDPLGRRISVTDGSQTTGYAYDGQNIHLEFGGAAAQASYVDLRVDEPLEMTRAGSPFYYLQDARGSTASLTDAGGSVAATTDMTLSETRPQPAGR